MTDKLVVGFWAATGYNEPRMTAAAPQAPAPGSVFTVTLGGPRKRDRVEAEIDACEKTLAALRAELTALNGIILTQQTRPS